MDNLLRISTEDLPPNDPNIEPKSVLIRNEEVTEVKEDPGVTATTDSKSEFCSLSVIIFPCKVCRDVPADRHYGVYACISCEAFFRRSVQKNKVYVCRKDKKCLVIPNIRNMCRYCRFKKCLHVGMSRYSVPIRRSHKQREETNQDIESDQHALETVGDDKNVLTVIQTITDAHKTFCAYTEDKTKNLTRKPVICSLEDGTREDANINTAESLEQKKAMRYEFAELLTPSIEMILEIAKRDSAFDTLTGDDKVILIKQGFFKIWVVHISRQIISSDNTITFHDGCFFTKQQMELIFDHDFVCLLFNLADSINNLQLFDDEIALLSTIVLLESDHAELSSRDVINQQKEEVSEALKYLLVRNHPDNPHIYQLVIDKLPELQVLGTKHAEHHLCFRADWAQLNLPPLFADTLDIPSVPR